MSAPAAVLAVLLAGLSACAGESDPEAGAAPGPRGVAVLEPPWIAVGQVTRLEVAVVTPPDYRLIPFEVPTSLPGLWVLDASAREVERRESHWVHRTRVRLRAREVGRFAWPALRVEVEAPDSTRTAIEIDERPVEVVSVLGQFPDQRAPFGLRAPGATGSRGRLLGAAGVGAALALAGVAGVAGIRRARARRARLLAQRRALLGRPPWEEAEESLAAAEDRLADDPRGAAHLVATALCRFVTRRFAAAASTTTTEELEAMRPPYAARSHWPALIGAMRDLDDVRFRPVPPGATSEIVAAALAAAREIVADATPPEGLR